MKWKPISWEQCPICDADTEVFSDDERPNFVGDGDRVKCTECEARGWTWVDNNSPFVCWDPYLFYKLRREK